MNILDIMQKMEKGFVYLPLAIDALQQFGEKLWSLNERDTSKPYSITQFDGVFSRKWSWVRDPFHRTVFTNCHRTQTITEYIFIMAVMDSFHLNICMSNLNVNTFLDFKK